MKLFTNQQKKSLGQGMIEYMIILCLVVVGAMVIVGKLGENTRKGLGNANAKLTGQNREEGYSQTAGSDTQSMDMVSFDDEKVERE